LAISARHKVAVDTVAGLAKLRAVRQQLQSGAPAALAI
jgi:hypothetical protein